MTLGHFLALLTGYSKTTTVIVIGPDGTRWTPIDITQIHHEIHIELLPELSPPPI